MRKPGQIEPVFFFVNGADPNHPPGYIMLAPYTGGGDRCQCPTPSGYRLEYADTLPAVDLLERTLQQQEREQSAREGEREWALLEVRRKAIRDRLYERINSSSTDEWTREFLKLWLQLSDERKRQQYAQRFLEHESYLWARHNDCGDRKADSEEVSLDKLTMRT